MHVTNVNDLLCLLSIPQFYQDIWLSFYECKSISPMNELNNFNFLTCTIWGNSRLKFKNKCLFFKNWIESGIIFIKDLYDENGHCIDEKTLLDKLNFKVN